MKRQKSCGFIWLALVCYGLVYRSRDAFLVGRTASGRNTTLGRAAGIATSIVPAIREALEETGCLSQWLESAHLLETACDLDSEEAETILAKGFGWSTWLAVNRAAYLKPEDPKVEEIAEAIGFFKEGPLKLTPLELRAVLRESPKALAKPMMAYDAARQTAPEEFQSPEAFRELVLRCPMVLELSFNCGYSCSAACSRCWCPAMTRIKKVTAT